MYLRYENGCVYYSHTGKAGSFSPLFFCDEVTWQHFLFDTYSGLRDYEDCSCGDFPDDDDSFDDPFDYDFDI